MPNRKLAEFLLARAVGRTRAAAIIGDLLELSATRGRLWYCTAYIRTLVSVIWRGPAAFLIAGVIFCVLYRLNLYRLSMMMVDFSRRSAAVPNHPYVIQTLITVMFQLWFLVPFAAVRYGFRDRFVRLTFATSINVSFAFYCLTVPVLPLVLAVVALLAVAALLVSAQWRGGLIALAVASAVGIVTLFNLEWLAHLGCWIYEHKPLNATSHYHYFETGYAFPRTIFRIVWRTIPLLEMLTLSFVCSRLHSRLWPSSSRDAKTYELAS